MLHLAGTLRQSVDWELLRPAVSPQPMQEMLKTLTRHVYYSFSLFRVKIAVVRYIDTL